MSSRFQLINLPMPPSGNDRLIPVIRGGRPRLVPSKALTDFKKEMEVWFKQNLLVIGKGRQIVAGWKCRGLMIRFEIDAYFPSSKIWLKNAEPRSCDADNRVKALQDVLTDLLMVEDKYCFETAVRKVESLKGEEKCRVRLFPIKAMNSSKVYEEEQEWLRQQKQQ
jgi:Holliday junction resolvase RusA-like endonuclease